QQRSGLRRQGKRRRHQDDLLRQSRTSRDRRQTRFGTGADGGQREYLCADFSGTPLPKAELTIIGPSKWEKPLVTDEQGRVTLPTPTPWAGRYVLEVTHEKAG